jgi:hypothetical protein
MERRSERLKSPTPERRRRALTVRPSRLANGLDELDNAAILESFASGGKLAEKP